MIAQIDRIVELNSRIGTFNGPHSPVSFKHTAVTESGRTLTMTGAEQMAVIKTLKMCGIPMASYRRGYVSGLRVEWPR